MSDILKIENLFAALAVGASFIPLVFVAFDLWFKHRTKK